MLPALRLSGYDAHGHACSLGDAGYANDRTHVSSGAGAVLGWSLGGKAHKQQGIVSPTHYHVSRAVTMVIQQHLFILLWLFHKLEWKSLLSRISQNKFCTRHRVCYLFMIQRVHIFCCKCNHSADDLHRLRYFYCILLNSSP